MLNVNNLLFLFMIANVPDSRNNYTDKLSPYCSLRCKWAVVQNAITEHETHLE